MSPSAGGLLWLSVFPLLAVAGAPLLAHRAYAGIPHLARAVLAGAAGAALVSLTMTAFALLGIPWSLPAVLAAAAALGFASRAALRHEASAPSPSPRARRAPGTGGAALVAAPSFLPALFAAVAVGAAFLAAAAGSASSPDLLFFWGPKAQRFALAHTVDAAYLGDPALFYMHAYYPPLVTNLYALASMAAGRMSWTAATLLFPLLLAALAVALPSILRMGAPAGRGTARTTSAAASALAVGAIAVIGMTADIGGNGEMPLLLFEAAGIALLLSPLANGAAGQLLAGWLFAGAVTAKIEGLPFALSAIAAFLWMGRRSRPGAAALRLFGPALLSVAAWFAFGATRRLFWGYSGEGRFLDFHPEFAGAVLRAVARTLASTGHGLPYVVPLLCLLAALRGLDARAAIPLAAAAGLAAFGFLIYLDRPSDPTVWIVWSAARVFSPIPVMLALTTATRREQDEPAAAP